MKKITVLLVDDHTVVRQGLRALLSLEEDIEVVGEAENARQAVRMAMKAPPDVVVMDLMMPFMNGLEGTRQMRKYVPSAKVLVLSSHNDEDYVQQMIEIGASGYLTKHTVGDDLVLAVREVQKGNAFFSPAIMKRLQDHWRHAFAEGKPRQRNVKLTSREAEVLQLVAEGLQDKESAGELGVSAKTINKHRQQVMNKLKIHNVVGLTRYAIAKGVLSRDQALKLDGWSPVQLKKRTGKDVPLPCPRPHGAAASKLA
jgi:DNA-binding NarL/FixJ family response regulator